MSNRPFAFYAIKRMNRDTCVIQGVIEGSRANPNAKKILDLL